MKIMIDIRKLVCGLSQAICKVDFPDAASLACALDMDISQARIAKMKAGDVMFFSTSMGSPAVTPLRPMTAIWKLFSAKSQDSHE
jgi:hypothetical protein